MSTETGAGGGAAGGAGGTGKDCTNGVDDDGDGLIDCADPQCQPGFLCVPAAPAGWSTPGYHSVRESQGPVKPCGEGFDQQALFSGLEQEEPSCNCNCSYDAGLCSASATTIHSSPTCSDNGSATGSGCAWLYTSEGIKGQVDLSAGSCAPGAAFDSPPVVSWKIAADRCAPPRTGGGCGSDEVCVPRPPSGFSEPPCVVLAGEHDCPSGYPAKGTGYATEDLIDSRACSAVNCGCNDPTGESCSIIYYLYSELDCTGVSTNVALNGTCYAVPEGMQALSTAAIDAYGGVCSSTGSSSVTGTVTGADQHTVCCGLPE